MASPRERNGDGIDDLPDSPTNIYPPFPTVLSASQFVRAKRLQVKNACTKCQKACKKCDQARPCLRCVRYGYGVEECLDSQRKERRKGAKRGPYKKRDGKGKHIARSDQGEPESESSPPPSGSPSTDPGADSAPVGYTPPLYAQYPLLPSHKSGEPAYYHQFYLTTAPSNAGPEGEGTTAYPPPPQLFPATFFTAYPPQYSSYVVHTSPEGQMAYASMPYAGSADVQAEPPVLDADGRVPSAARKN
ncbi:hypothetical protein C8F04DRAFT_1074538 [Mycena alexandri]|uniref:Zn(2)-C6 fungal-type domain-containing protein n=1 Tax=Mycena alexandri TaxID=1745969 RepID=A0AAD6TBB2_9AGAR|nr:hypothetical protein C8F04DRAFT_1074538 [Mycena alexandri]